MTHPVLVTGVAGRVGGVGGLVVEALQRRGLPSAPGYGARTSAPRRCLPHPPTDSSDCSHEIDPACHKAAPSVRP